MKTCPICGWEGDAFLPQNLKFSHDESRQLHRDCTCPQCRSHHRHRSAWLTLDKFSLPGEGKHILHVAPEPFLVERFRKGSASYTAIDKYVDERFEANLVLEMDLTDLKFRDDQFDFIYCAHVLEHIADDRRAISELSRVLRPGGIAVLSVPVYPIEKTADLYHLSPDAMWHVHQPGRDYYKRYMRAGLSTTVIYPEENFDMGRFGLRAIWDPVVIARKSRLGLRRGIARLASFAP
jgi:SAM-dependent methyltransferase